MIKLCITVSSRANYSSLKTLIELANADPEVELQIIAYGTSHSKKYGNVVDDIRRCGVKVNFCLSTHVDGNSTENMSKSAGLGIIEFSTAFSVLRPDIVVIVGDRFEIISPVIAAAYQNIPIAHTMGGEITGTIDESIRHAVTKFAHMHFVATDLAAHRVRSMGEPAHTVFKTGCPRIDMVRKAISQIDQNDLQIYLNEHGVGGELIDIKKPFILFSYHPVTTELQTLAQDLQQSLDALDDLDLPVISIWPNADAGTETISQKVRHIKEQKRYSNRAYYTNLPTELYSQLMALTSCLVGNSSSGVREGAFIGTPVVNIGTRQNNRECASNVISVNNSRSEIVSAVKKHLMSGKYPSSDLYGDGYAAKKILCHIKQSIPKTTQKILDLN